MSYTRNLLFIHNAVIKQCLLCAYFEPGTKAYLKKGSAMPSMLKF